MVESEPERAETLLNDNDSMRDEVIVLLNALQQYHSRYLAALECIACLQFVMKSDYKYSKRVRYNLGLQLHLGETAEVKAMVEAIKCVDLVGAIGA